MASQENPAAFPSQPLGEDGLPTVSRDAGMTLRDYFAAHALPYTLDLNHKFLATKRDVQFPFAEAAAKDAYDIADAMLAARVSA